ncbi:MAG TPA: hypothetical protein VJL35_14455 [Gemmatimonadaceae bacterium]|jgi:hypothetical protein|nr:hypothetical protein [Gemmatimonadaceae bacterium]
MKNQDELNTLLKLNARAWGIAVGLLFGLGIFLATVFLLIKGGPNVGPHLGLIGQYLPGYSVTWPGAFIGFVYLFVIGYAIGRIIGGVYNALVRSE